MVIKGWRCYHQAAIPECAPHEEPDLEPIRSGAIWNMDGRPLLVRWTEDFDCGCETNWWYTVKDAPFDPETLSSGARKHIRQALKKCCVRQIDPVAYEKQLYDCYAAAHRRYKNSGEADSYEHFRQSLLYPRKDRAVWGGFAADTDQLIGYMIVYPYESHAEIAVSKFDPEHLNYRVSDALYASVLQYYLNECEKAYVSSGSRSIHHETNSEAYKIDSFGYRKAYCKLRIVYRPAVKWGVKLLYPFRGIFRRLDSIRLVHMLNSILNMEEIQRKQR